MVLSCSIQCIQTDFHRADPFLGACVEYLQIAASLRDCTARVGYLAPLPNDTSWNSRIKVTKVCQNRAKKAEIKIRTLLDWVHDYRGTVIFSSRWQVHWKPLKKNSQFSKQHSAIQVTIQVPDYYHELVMAGPVQSDILA